MTHVLHCYFFSCSVGFLFAQQGLVSLITLVSLGQCCLHCILLLNESQAHCCPVRFFWRVRNFSTCIGNEPWTNFHAGNKSQIDQIWWQTHSIHPTPSISVFMYVVSSACVHGVQSQLSFPWDQHEEWENWIPPSRRCASARARTWLKTHRLYVFYTISHFSVL